MKKYFFFFFLFFSASYVSHSQITGVQWQKTFGGSNIDAFHDVKKTKDQGILLLYGSYADTPGVLKLVKINQAGYTEWKKDIPIKLSDYKGCLLTSNDELFIVGDSYGGTNHGGYDYWVGKISPRGDLVWQNSYGGSGNDNVSSFARDGDGNIIIAGRTSSGNGDVTNGNHGLYDIWVLKLSQDGAILWNRCLGGTNSEVRNQALVKPINNGYLILSETLSNDGDASGHQGSWDIWLVKLTTSGTIEWQNQYGSTDEDDSKDIVEAATGGYYILGYTYSAAIPNSHWSVNGPDLYVIKIGDTGSFEWHKCFGGYDADKPIALFAEDDGGCVFFANVVVTGSSGDIIGFSGSYHEIWSAKINTSGNIVWQRCLGGNGEDGALSVLEEKFDDNNVLLPDNDRSYIILASTSSWTRDVLGFHNSAYPYADMWLSKMKKSDRTLLWSRCFGGSYAEYYGALVKSNQKEFVIGCLTESIDGDVVGNHGAAQTPDAWIVKFGPANTIKGIVFLDMNSNGVKDPAEKYYSNALVKSEKVNDTKISVTVNGLFKNDADTGSYTTSIISSLPYYISSLPSRQSVFTQYNQKDSFAIPLIPIPGHRDLKVFLIPLNSPRPNWFASYRVICTNTGSEIISSPSVKFIKDGRTNWGISAPLANTVVADTSIWTLSSLAPFDTIVINLSISIPPPPALNQGDIIKSIVAANSFQPEETPFDNSDTLYQVLLNAYDPNNKTENHGGKILQEIVQAGGYLNYIIRFQNTGTAAALDIKIKDTLDSKLDWNSLQVISSSHRYELNIKDGNKLTWNFPSINLPDSNANEPASHGFIAYRIKPLNSLATGDIISNSASIYFDFNIPVKTNNWFTEVIGNAPPIPIINSFAPVTAGAGTTISITGINFSGATAVSFGGVAATSFTVNSSTSITAIVGTGASGNVTVTTPLGTATMAGFTFIPPPTITSFTPTSGGTGTTVTITGTNLAAVTSVSFGAIAATSFVVNSSTSITAVVGGGASGNVSVTTAGGVATLAGFTFIPAPTITSFTPTSAGTGTTITVTGTNFTGATVVSFGGIAASSFVIISPTSITAIVGAGASGNLNVTTLGGTATKAGFTFIPPPTITSFTPTNGGAGTTITITGTNFTGATSVSFGTVAATSFTVNSSTTITAVVGNGASGNVAVTTPGGSATMAGFIFIAAPTISSFAPTSAAMGATVTITGANFTDATAVSFGGIAATSFVVNSSTTITAVVAATGASGNIAVTTAGGTASISGFTFISSPTISSFTPTSAGTGATITITGTNLAGTSSVSFGGIPATSFVVNSSTSLAAVVGAGASGSVSVTTPGGTVTMTGFTFNMVTAVGNVGGAADELKIYPNPANDYIIIEHPSLNRLTQFQWIDLAGRLIKINLVNKNTTKTEINAKGVSPGIYKLVWRDGTHLLAKTVLIWR